jgi:hypothetical protein
MCLPGEQPAPASAADAAAMARAALAWIADADMTALTAAEQADCLRELERAESMHLAARASVLAAFAAAGGYEDDGHGSARTWLKWQTQITGAAAAGAIGWTRRLSAHPAVRVALCAGTISVSWAREICDWTDLLPGPARAGADTILLSAAACGAELADLAGLAEEMRKRTAQPDTDDDGFDDRWLRLNATFRGAGHLDAGLTPQCTAALTAVLDALGKKAGPEDTRTRRQRDHDALEEAMRRLIASGCLPDRAGQPTQIMLHMTLEELRRMDAGHAGQSAGPAGPAARPAGPGAAPAAGPGAACDATIVPVVSGSIDPDLLSEMTAEFLRDRELPDPLDAGRPERAERDARAEREARAARAAGQMLVRDAAALLSGPRGLASQLRAGLLFGTAASPSLLLDIGTASDSIPAHLRRAVTIRDRHCRFPGCEQPPAACQPHHLIPRADGGPHSLTNLLLLCTFHHLIAVHRWGWTLTLNPDITVTATSPDETRIFHSHSPPASAARQGVA